MKSNIVAGAFASAMAVASCQSTVLDRSTSSQAGTGSVVAIASAQKTTVQFFPKSCLEVRTSPPGSDNESVLSLLAPIFASILSETLINYVSAQLKEARDARTGSFGATGYAATGRELQCMAVTRGKYGATPATADPVGMLELASLQNLGLAEPPDFVALLDMEVRGQNLHLQTEYLHYAQTSAKSRGSGTKEVSMSITLTSLAPPEAAAPATPAPASAPASTAGAKPAAAVPASKKEPEKVVGSAIIAFGPRQVGGSYYGDTLRGDEVYLPIPKNSQASPYQAVVVVNETEDPNLALKFFVDSFGNHEDDLQKAVATILKQAAGVKDKQDEAPKEK